MTRSIMFLSVSLAFGHCFCQEASAQSGRLTAYETRYTVLWANDPDQEWVIQVKRTSNGSWQDWRGGYSSRQSAEQALWFAFEHGQLRTGTATRIVQRNKQPAWRTGGTYETRQQAQDIVNRMRAKPAYADALFRIVPTLIHKASTGVNKGSVAKDAKIVKPTNVGNQPSPPWAPGFGSSR